MDNYSLIDFDLENDKNLLNLCKFDYSSLFEVILQSKSIDVNSTIKFQSRKFIVIDQEQKKRWYFDDHFDYDFYRFYLKEEEKTALIMKT